MSGGLIVPDKRINFLRNGGVAIEAEYLERIGLKKIADDMRLLWYWVNNPKVAEFALDPENDVSEVTNF